MKIPQTVKFSDVVHCSTTAYWTPKTQSRELAELAVKAFDEFKKLLSFPDDIKIILKTFKRDAKRGCYYSGHRIAVINPRNRTKRGFLETMAHELVHAEQYHTGRMKDRNKTCREWDGQIMKSSEKNYQTYLNLPWEIDARSRQGLLAVQVMKNLGMTEEEIKDTETRFTPTADEKENLEIVVDIC